MNVYFSDVFQVSSESLEQYGAFNLSVLTDLPLFIDPFLLFNSKKPEYQNLHNEIINYLSFLRDKSRTTQLDRGLLGAWYRFAEVKQNWFGFCISGNQGRGLGPKFAMALHSNLHNLFTDFGQEKVTSGSHLEKLCLVKDGVGRDNISDFVTNLIKEFLLEYTQNFAIQYINEKYRSKVPVTKARFNYKTETWETVVYELPKFRNDYVLLTPNDLLTKDDIWINKTDLERDFDNIPSSIPNQQLRAQINNYFLSVLPKDADNKERTKAIRKVLEQFPEVIDYYIKFKEERGDTATSISEQKVDDSRRLYVEQFRRLIELLEEKTGFYESEGRTSEDAYERILYLKEVIEKQDGYRIFYVKGQPIKKEEDLQIAYKLTWFAASSDVNREVNNGRGPVDFKISRGSKDKTLVEFKLASNSQLARNLQNQVEIYEAANNTNNSFKVIMYFTEAEHDKVQSILRTLKLDNSRNIILIDARSDNKPSASTA